MGMITSGNAASYESWARSNGSSCLRSMLLIESKSLSHVTQTQGEGTFMKQGSRVGLAVGFLFVFTFVFSLIGPAALAQMPQPFSADFSSASPDGMKKTGKWFFSPPKMRIDMNMPQGNGPLSGNVSMIIDGSTHTSYMVMPQAQMYMEIEASGARDMQGLRNLES